MIHISDEESHCRIDAGDGVVQGPLREIGLKEARIETSNPFEVEATLDLTVLMKGLQPRQFFASVLSSGAEGLKLRWTPIDTSEQARLRSLLEAYRTLHKPGPAPAPAPAPEKHEKAGTRRMIKPKSAHSSGAIEPFAEASAPPAPIVPPSFKADADKDAAAKEAPAKGVQPTSTSARVRTRRIVRPSQGHLPRVQDITPFSEEKPAAPADAPKARQADEPTPAKPAPRKTGSDLSEANVAIFDTTPSGATPVLPADTTPRGTPIQEPEDEPAAAEGKAAIIGSDGRMDIGASIRSRAKSIKASDLAARHDRVRVLNMGTIKQLIQEAVEEASHHFSRSLNETDRKRLLEEAEEGFKERLKAFEAEKLSAEARLTRLTDQLGLAQKTLQEERSRTIKADQFTVSASGLDEIEQKFKRLLEHSIAEGRVVASLEEELRKVIATVFDQERARIREQEMKAQNEKIQLLESKIKRLSTSLEDTERQRDEMSEWAKMMEAQGGGALRNVFSAGMKDGDPNKKRKLALMKEILDINRAIRKDLGIETKPVDDETLEAIKKAEAAATLTEEEKALIQQRRLHPDPEPAAKPDAEMANVLAEGRGDRGEDGEAAAEAAGNPDDQPWEDERRKVTVAAGAVKVTSGGTETLEEGAQIDPDDLPWQPNADGGDEEAEGSSVKKIKSDAGFRMPPLERK